MQIGSVCSQTDTVQRKAKPTPARLAVAEDLEVNGDVLWSGYRTGNPFSAKIGHSGGNYGGIGYNLDFTTTTGIFNRPLIDYSSYLEFTQGGFKFLGTNHFGVASNINLLGGGQNLNLFAVITKEGNMGIGIASPTDKLAVNGNIRAREIKVDNANWPDYVFKSDYQLPSLEETAAHIREKGHLKNIPSAAEVEEKGVSLGDLNAKLLQKIEELTLYVINQNEQLKKQDAVLNSMVDKVQKLQTELISIKSKPSNK